MKRFIICILAFLLIFPCSFAEEEQESMYRRGAAEMLRHYWVRNANPAYAFSMDE